MAMHEPLFDTVAFCADWSALGVGMLSPGRLGRQGTAADPRFGMPERRLPVPVERRTLTKRVKPSMPPDVASVHRLHAGYPILKQEHL